MTALLPSSPSPLLPCFPVATLLSSNGSNSSRGVSGCSGTLVRKRGGEEDQISLLALLLAALRRTLAGFRAERGEKELGSMEIGGPTDVRHVAHVTFDRFHGFLGLPVEFEPEVPRRAPSASANVFGVSTESMQCSYDTRGNSVPTILLLMQWRLYEQGGLRAEGIFRINAENSQEEYVRDQLNSGIVPDGIDVHCLAGLIKAWFRELPNGVLDSLNPEQVMQCQSEEECAELVKLLPPTESSLLDWAINLMADVVQEEEQNKMNARNIAMVFAPNMTQMVDPLTALMYAVQVMNFLKTLILKTLKERQEPVLEDASVPHLDPFNENGHHCPQLPLQTCSEEEATEQVLTQEENSANGEIVVSEDTSAEYFTEEILCEIPPRGGSTVYSSSRRTRRGRSSGGAHHKKGTRKASGHAARSALPGEKPRGASVVSRINSKVERVEAWR